MACSTANQEMYSENKLLRTRLAESTFATPKQFDCAEDYPDDGIAKAVNLAQRNLDMRLAQL